MSLARLFLALLLLLIGGASWAQAASDPPAGPVPVAAQTAVAAEAEVVVINRTVTVFRAPYLGAPGAARRS